MNCSTSLVYFMDSLDIKRADDCSVATCLHVNYSARALLNTARFYIEESTEVHNY